MMGRSDCSSVMERPKLVYRSRYRALMPGCAGSSNQLRERSRGVGFEPSPCPCSDPFVDLGISSTSTVSGLILQQHHTASSAQRYAIRERHLPVDPRVQCAADEYQ